MKAVKRKDEWVEVTHGPVTVKTTTDGEKLHLIYDHELAGKMLEQFLVPIDALATINQALKLLQEELKK